MNKNITLDTVVAQYKGLRDIIEITDFVDHNREKLVEEWGITKYTAVLGTLVEEAVDRKDSVVNNLAKLHKEDV